MVRLLSLVIVLLVPNLFAPGAPHRAVPRGHAPVVAAPEEYLVPGVADVVAAKVGWHSGDPDLAQGEPVPTRRAPLHAEPPARSHPTLEPSLDR